MSGRSQGPEDARHTVPTLLNELAGQSLSAPVQYSAMSQVPAAARQILVFPYFASTRQTKLVPLQVSALSHAPAAGRQTVPDFAGPHTPSTVAPAAMLQAWQSVAAPLPQDELQHTPSTQKPLRHAVPDAQAEPFGRSIAWAAEASKTMEKIMDMATRVPLAGKLFLFTDVHLRCEC